MFLDKYEEVEWSYIDLYKENASDQFVYDTGNDPWCLNYIRKFRGRFKKALKFDHTELVSKYNIKLDEL